MTDTERRLANRITTLCNEISKLRGRVEQLERENGTINTPVHDATNGGK